MTDTPLPEALGREQLTDALRDCGVLGGSRVREVTVVSSRPTILSRIIRLRLEFDGSAPDAPRSIVFKTAHPDRVLAAGWEAGRDEVDFYARVAPEMPRLAVPRCFAAVADERTKEWHLLLEDLTDSHVVPTAWPLPPSEAQCAAIVEARARFHAAWWGDPRLNRSIGVAVDEAATRARARDLAAKYARLADRLGDNLPHERRTLYERLLDAAPNLLARAAARPDLTITQVDAHVWNCFLPRDGGDDVRFFDWDAWRVRPGAGDLAYMMAIHWYPDRRARYERKLLDRYHAALLAEGVTGYDRAALDDDYRWAVLWQTTTPIWQAAYDIPPLIWWNNLERVWLAVDDLDCRALLS